MRFRPLHDRVLVRRIEEAETIRGGIIIPDSAKEKPQEGEAVACGNGRLLNSGRRVALAVQPGDRVLFVKYGGNEINLESEEYLILREDEILGILDKREKSDKKGQK
jgi:chaperonin GroES